MSSNFVIPCQNLLQDEEMRKKVERLMQETSPGNDENLYVEYERLVKRPKMENSEDTLRKS